MSQALYRKYRSKNLKEVVGQDHVTKVLANSLKKGIVSHAYLLTGPRGVGKTSIARILAHEINQLDYSDESNHLDIVEIDAASNNGVEDVRELRERARIAPTSAKKKIYIIDEVHMLSKPAFNALLKTLEEPPEHVVFILATTDIDKLPATIISRTQRFNFRRISLDDAAKHLASIAKKEAISIDKDALRLVAQHGDGSFRDSISLLDQLRSLVDDKETITPDKVEAHLGLAPRSIIEKILNAHKDGDLTELVKICDEIESKGIAAVAVTEQLMSAIRTLVATQPELLPLLERLIEVQKSSHPHLKLLVALAPKSAIPTAAPKPVKKSAALASVSPSVSAPIAELERQAVKPHPKITTSAAKPVVKKSNSDQKKSTPTDIDWANFVEAARQESVALFSVLSKCSQELVDGVLNIYARNSFYKKKLEDGRHQRTLGKILESLNLTGLDIIVHPTPPPPKDSQIAAIAAIMGGGEEVEV